ncbi:MAG TPA: hypothetical protein VNT56_03200 [Acidimicrobiales bacterium]|nr:hypothetical protein [Acidimicrobiales bacterium]
MAAPPPDKHTTSEALDLGEDGEEVVIEQQNVGRQQAAGGGEWPDPRTPPSDAAPGSTEAPGGDQRPE